MQKTDKSYIEYRRAEFRKDAENIKAHFAKHSRSIADVRCDVYEYEILLEVFREVLDEKELKRCNFFKTRA